MVNAKSEPTRDSTFLRGQYWRGLDRLGRLQQGREAYNTAAIFQPDLPVSAIGLSRIELFRGEFDRARVRCEGAREKYKSNPQLLMMAAQIECLSCNFGPAGRNLYSKLMKGDHAGGVGYPGSVRFLSAIASIHATRGVPDAKALLHEALMLDNKEVSAAPDNPARLYSLAADYAALGEEYIVAQSARYAMAARWIDYRSMTLDPRFDAVRATPGFQQAIVHLQQATREMAERTNK